MADSCQDLSASIKRLEAAINQQNQCCQEARKEISSLKDRVNKLEKRPSTPGEKVDLRDIYKRLTKLEKDVEALKTGIIQTLYNFADIEEVNREFTQAFQALYDMFIPIIEFVGGIFGFLGEE